MTLSTVRRSLYCLTALFAGTSNLHAQMKYECIKFWVYRSEGPGTTRLWRIGLKDGSHLYTVNKSEVERLVRAKLGAVEPMDAFVATAPGKGLVYLRRFTLKTPSAVRGFLTASPAEARDVAAKRGAREIKTDGYVFPHDFKPDGEQVQKVVPVYWFHNATSGEHFYTTAEKEKVNLVGLGQSAQKPPATAAQGAAEKDILAASADLATIELNHPPQQGEALIGRFAESLRMVYRTYPDVPPKEVAATIHAAYRVLKEKGKPLPLEKVARMVGLAVPTVNDPKERPKFGEIAAAVTAAFSSGQYGDDSEQAGIDARAAIELLMNADKRDVGKKSK